MTRAIDATSLGLLALGAAGIGLAARLSGSRNEGLPDLSLERVREGQQIEAAKPYVANGITFDAREGAGAVPNNESIDHFGFVVWLRPNEYLKLNPSVEHGEKQTRKHEAWLKSLDQGVRLGPPFLDVKLETEEDERGVLRLESHEAQVTGHEGRHRMRALMAFSDEPVPVHVFVRGLRTRSLRNLDLSRLRFVSDRRHWERNIIRPHAWALEGIVHRHGSGSHNRKVPSTDVLVRKLEMPRTEAERVRELMIEGRIVPALQAARSAMGGYDVKVVRGKRDLPGCFSGLEYVDHADAWRDTLIYDYGRDEFLVAPWGGHVDANPERF